MTRFRNNILLQYTLITLVSIFAISFILGSLIVNWSSDSQIKKHLELYPQIVRLKLVDSPELAGFIINKSFRDHQSEMGNFADELLSLGSIFRVKIWDMENTVVWSNDSSIIGKTFQVNELYKIAITGKNAYEVTKPDKLEQVSEAIHHKVLEIYIPVYYGEKVVGACEIYEAADVILGEIEKNAKMIWLITGISGLILYLLQFGIFYNSYRKQKEVEQNLLKTQDVTIYSLAAIAETKDKETGDHILRTKMYVNILAQHLRKKSKFKHYLTEEKIQELIKSSPLHDIGKVGISDSILNKPGKLTVEEFDEMKKHPKYGYDALSISFETLGSNSFLETARELIYSHHEKWDGSGYPDGLKGEAIPISGRIMALADVYDALISKRVYKEAFSSELAREIITEGRGIHFDPDVVDAFIEGEEEFIRIANEFSPKNDDIEKS